MNKLFKNKKAIICGVVIFIVLLRFWNLTGLDLISDDALYSFRALGWFDYLGGGQTTPVQWFGNIPWWGNLSFHDAPPLVFAIQKIFFMVFGANALAARLPFALAGLGVVYLMYLIVKKMANENLAIGAALIMAVSSYGSWASRTGYLEGIQVVFIVLSLFFFIQFVAHKKSKDILLWGVSAGLAMACKYTAMFILPAGVLYFLIWNRKVFSNKYFWFSILAYFAALLPAIIYNIFVWKTRGHLDATLSPLIGLHPDDFIGLKSLGVSSTYWTNVKMAVKIIFDNTSLMVFVFYIGAIIYAFAKMIRKKTSALENTIVVFFVMIVAMLIFMGPATRRISIMVPFLILFLISFISDTYLMIKNKRMAYIWLAIIIAAFGWELLFNVNTNITSAAPNNRWLYSQDRFYNLGFNQVDEFLQSKIFDAVPTRKINSMTQLNDNFKNISGRDVVIYDDTISWFAYSWYIQKYQFYYEYPTISFASYLKLVDPNSKATFSLLSNGGARGIYYIYASDQSVLDSVSSKNEQLRKMMVSFADQLDAGGLTPTEIFSDSGKLAFKIYYIPLK